MSRQHSHPGPIQIVAGGGEGGRSPAAADIHWRAPFGARHRIVRSLTNRRRRPLLLLGSPATPGDCGRVTPLWRSQKDGGGRGGAAGQVRRAYRTHCAPCRTRQLVLLFRRQSPVQRTTATCREKERHMEYNEDGRGIIWGGF